MASKSSFFKVIIGRSVAIELPTCGIAHIPAKIDTGAYRSAVHASDIRLDERTGKLTYTLLAGHPIYGKQPIVSETTEFSKVVVENSFGQAEERFEVQLRVKLGPKVFNAPFTLADRSKKVYPVLLGRTLLSGRFLVDTSMASIDRRQLRDHGIQLPLDQEDGRSVPESVLLKSDSRQG